MDQAATDKAQYAADQAYRARRQADPTRNAALVAIVALVVSIIGAIFAWRAFDLARQNFRVDERAYLLVEDIKGQTKDFRLGQRARWDIQYVNYGKTPTIREATDAHVWIGTSALFHMIALFRKLPTKKPPRTGEFVTPPNASGGPDGFHYVSLFSDTVVTATDVTFMKANDGGVVMAGRVWYDDIFGFPHWTDFCRYTLMTGGISDCPVHNEMH